MALILQKSKSSYASICVFFMSTLYIECDSIQSKFQEIAERHYSPMPKIYKGVPSSYEDYSHQYLVSLQILMDGESNNSCYYRHVCGGVILDTHTAITVAHCLQNELKSNCCLENPQSCYRIVAGKHDLSSDFSRNYIVPEQAVNISTNYIKIHENYQFLLNDIAIIHLEQPLQFNRYVKSIPLIDPNNEYGTAATIVGWGDDNNLPTEAKVTIYGHRKCEEVFGDYYYSNLMLCAGGNKDIHNGRVSDACSGDSGGPLLVSDPENRTQQHLFGLISWGSYDCGMYPGIYTNVAPYLDWIKKQREGRKRRHSPHIILQPNGNFHHHRHPHQQ